MKAVVVMFDSLNRHMLSPYGCDWTHTPNFQRLARRSVTFDRSYVCSMPCMPARYELHAARPNFLHRSWGPLEPFTDSVPRMLSDAGVSTHLITDHYHYFEDGGATYHTKYDTWQFMRGQEGDPWMGQVDPPPVGSALGNNAATAPKYLTQDRINRRFMRREEDQPQAKTFDAGIDFIRRNAQADNWFLQIEAFDPHEPFFSHSKYKDRFAEHYDQWRAKGNAVWDWPSYDYVTEPPDHVEHMRYEYASLLAMCDAKLGGVLDLFDELQLWDDTMLIVMTDHGFLLGEHDCWAKCWMPFYNEIANTPLFIWDPRCGKRDERCSALVQPALDSGPTLLDLFGVEPTGRMTGRSLRDTIDRDAPVRDAAIFGLHGGHVNVTDGRYVYMRGVANEHNQPLNQYTLMPTHMRVPFSVEELKAGTELVDHFPHTQGCPVLKIPVRLPPIATRDKLRETMLFDLEADPRQLNPVIDPAIERRMIDLMRAAMTQCDAPQEQYERLGMR
jgi:arylsulfatase A-like enzyme